MGGGVRMMVVWGVIVRGVVLEARVLKIIMSRFAMFILNMFGLPG